MKIKDLESYRSLADELLSLWPTTSPEVLAQAMYQSYLTGRQDAVNDLLDDILPMRPVFDADHLDLASLTTKPIH